MIAKYLLKFCSTEVKIMITRMKERPEDFKHGSTWRRLVEAVDKRSYSYTWAERIAIRTQWQQLEKDSARRELLARIMYETINPTSEESIEDGMSSYVNKVNYMQRAQNARAAHLQAHVTTAQGQVAVSNFMPYPSGFSDPHQLYGSPMQGRPL